MLNIPTNAIMSEQNLIKYGKLGERVVGVRFRYDNPIRDANSAIIAFCMKCSKIIAIDDIIEKIMKLFCNICLNFSISKIPSS